MGKYENPRSGRAISPPTAHNVTALPSSGLLAGRNWRKFIKLTDECDELVEEDRRLMLQFVEVLRRDSGTPVMELAKAEMGDYANAMVKRCRERLEWFDRPEYYEDDSEDHEDAEKILKLEVIVERLTMMYACADSGPTDTEPEGFVRMLSMHVYGANDTNLTYPALESGCRAIEKAQKPVRSIGYVLEVLQKHQEDWRKRRQAIYQIGHTLKRLREAILEAQCKLKREQAVMAVRDAERELQHMRYKLERLRKKESEADLAHQEAIAAREATERAIPGVELALQTAQAALAKLKADGVDTSEEQESFPTVGKPQRQQMSLGHTRCTVR